MVTLVAFALLSTAGCTSVAPGGVPDRLPVGRELVPPDGEAPTTPEPHTPAVQPSARDALVNSGARTSKGSKAGKAREAGGGAPRHEKKPAAVARERPAPAPPRTPARRAPAPPPPPARRPAPVAPRPAWPRQTYDGKVVCRMAEGVADPATVALCREQLG
ncbi:hypothetical protein [Streptomyces sp. NPDC057302]|uniref:hypothetical protein n=1 Tax=Streptomyces sp. NPDC057302 TaxID=3346094 RepID=UPI0036317E23